MELTNQQIQEITEIILTNDRWQAISKAAKVINKSCEFTKKYIPVFRKQYNIGNRPNSNYTKGNTVYTSEAIADMLSIFELMEEETALEAISEKYKVSKSNVIKRLSQEGFNVRDIKLLEGEEFRQYRDSNYFVSNKGRIYAKNKSTKRLLKTTVNSRGYVNIRIYIDGNKFTTGLHRLVAECFIPNPENKPQVDHIDTNRSNNCVENLRWVTGEENMNNELTRMHVSISQGGSSYGFTISIIDNNTGEFEQFSSMSSLYRHLGIPYIPKFVGTQQYKNYTIVMAGEDSDEYYIGKMLRQGLTKEELIEKVNSYNESEEYKKYIEYIEKKRVDQ